MSETASALYHREWRKNNIEANRLRQKKYHLKRAYGLTLEERESMGNTCALCGTTGKRMAVDHDHVTGKVRGILCLRCNGALGNLGDSIESLQRVIDYLSGTSSTEHSA